MIKAEFAAFVGSRLESRAEFSRFLINLRAGNTPKQPDKPKIPPADSDRIDSCPAKTVQMNPIDWPARLMANFVDRLAQFTRIVSFWSPLDLMEAPSHIDLDH